jgi:hypothetical protein
VHSKAASGGQRSGWCGERNAQIDGKDNDLIFTGGHRLLPIFTPLSRDESEISASSPLSKAEDSLGTSRDKGLQLLLFSRPKVSEWEGRLE